MSMFGEIAIESELKALISSLQKDRDFLLSSKYINFIPVETEVIEAVYERVISMIQNRLNCNG